MDLEGVGGGPDPTSPGKLKYSSDPPWKTFSLEKEDGWKNSYVRTDKALKN